LSIGYDLVTFPVFLFNFNSGGAVLVAGLDAVAMMGQSLNTVKPAYYIVCLHDCL
jgi:hypothetical protein